MANGKDVEGRTAPYLPYSTFKNFIGGFSGGTIPPRIDRSLMPKMSGADQSYMRTALRFFALVDAEKNDAVTERFRELVGVYGTERWKDVLRTVITDGYAPLVGDLDTSATPAQLDEAFREYGKVAGSALNKAVRFYLTAAEEAAIDVSPLFKKRSAVPSSSNGTRRARRVSREDQTPAPEQLAPKPAGTRKLRFTLPSGEVEVWLPEKITLKELKKLSTYMSDYQELLSDSDQIT